MLRASPAVGPPGGVFFAAWGAAGEDFDPGTKFSTAVPPPKTHFEDAWQHRSSTPSPAPSRTPATVRRTLLGTGLAAAYHHPSIELELEPRHGMCSSHTAREVKERGEEGGGPVEISAPSTLAIFFCSGSDVFAANLLRPPLSHHLITCVTFSY